MRHVLELRPVRSGLLVAATAAALSVVAVSGAHAQTAPDTENGRYTLSQSGNDLIRLDTRTGAVSTCTSKGGWVCRIVPDERAALDSEIGKLQADNKKLRDQLAARDAAPPKTDVPLAKEDSKKSAEAVPDKKTGENKIELTLPADHEKLMALLDKVWDRLIEMASRLQKKLSEKT